MTRTSARSPQFARRWLPAALARCGALALALAGGGAACADYDNNDVELAVQYSAKEMCSCLWVMGQTEDYCRAWIAASPAVAKVDVNVSQHTVTAHALTLWQTRARWQGPRYGCVVE